ncbi:MAG: 5-formyltetrahydrofolate cyclo-ligase [Lachnospiraceae bacterium]|nr:5-formyltetrahydrofolate cyclo-ligase [Lachnospiraceae bacterium]
MKKEELRKEAAARRDSLRAEEREEKSARIAETVGALPEFRRADAVCCYASFRTEVATERIMASALQEGKALFCPRILDAKASRMEFFRVTQQESELTAGTMGIPEPEGHTQSLPDWCAEKNAQAVRPFLFFVLPGLAFDSARRRIGYGKGFYDTYLQKLQQADRAEITTCAIAFPCQLFPAPLPESPLDIRPDILVTDAEIIRGESPEKG